MALYLALAGVMLAGCQDGPIPENRILNPWARKQWEEDEKFGPTYYKRVEELAAIRARAAGLPEEERERLAQEVADVYGLEPSGAMRCELIRTLGYLPAAAAQPALEAALTDEDRDVRIAACQSWSRVQGEGALAALAKAAEEDEDKDVRLAAVRGLGQFPADEAKLALGKALEDNDPALQKVAIDSLKRTTGEDYGMSVPAWKEYLAGGNPTKPPGPTLAERLSWPWY